MFTFETYADGTLATVPTATLATVETTYPDGVFPHYIVRDPSAPAAGEYLYIGDSHRQACSVASDYNIAHA